MKEEKFTYFWRTASPFSNWHPCSFEIDGITFNSSEQHMMYHKALLFKDMETASKILEEKTPGKQKALGREVKNFDQKVWAEHCKGIVYEGNKAKFTQNENLLKRLLKTQGTTIVEASPVDQIWGIGLAEDDPRAKSRHTWQGKNLLGEILTELREELLNNNSLKS